MEFCLADSPSRITGSSGVVSSVAEYLRIQYFNTEHGRLLQEGGTSCEKGQVFSKIHKDPARRVSASSYKYTRLRVHACVLFPYIVLSGN